MTLAQKLEAVQNALRMTLAQASTTACAYPEYAEAKQAVEAGRKALALLPSIIEQVTATESKAIPSDDWSEEDGNVLWWFFPISEPPYCGTPLDDSWPTICGESYHTHFTRIPLPQPPESSEAA